MSCNFFTLLECLNDANVKFVVVGGFAGVVHGCTIVTQDIDICCEFSPENLLDLQEAVKDLHPVHRMTPNRLELTITADNCQTLKNLYLETDLGQLDCLSEIDGVGDFQQVLQSSELVKVENRKFNILSIDALIKAKEKLGRPRDIEAVIQLKAAKKMKRSTEK